MRPPLFPVGAVFDGWAVVAAAFAAMSVSVGVAYSFGKCFEPFREEFGGDRGTVSLVFALTGLRSFGLGALTRPPSTASAFGCSVRQGRPLPVGLLLPSRAQAL